MYSNYIHYMKVYGVDTTNNPPMQCDAFDQCKNVLSLELKVLTNNMMKIISNSPNPTLMLTVNY